MEAKLEADFSHILKHKILSYTKVDENWLKMGLKYYKKVQLKK
jgi:hypothetical protein